MWSKEKPQNPEVERYDVRAIAFESGNIFAWLAGGARRDVFKIGYNPEASTPYIILHKEWEHDPIGAFPFQPFVRWFIGKNFYSLKFRWELVVCDSVQLREYSLVGVRQNIPAPIVAGL